MVYGKPGPVDVDDAPLWPRVNHRCRLAVVVIIAIAFPIVVVVAIVIVLLLVSALA